MELNWDPLFSPFCWKSSRSWVRELNQAQLEFSSSNIGSVIEERVEQAMNCLQILKPHTDFSNAHLRLKRSNHGEYGLYVAAHAAREVRCWLRSVWRPHSPRACLNKSSSRTELSVCPWTESSPISRKTGPGKPSVSVLHLHLACAVCSELRNAALSRYSLWKQLGQLVLKHCLVQLRW